MLGQYFPYFFSFHHITVSSYEIIRIRLQFTHSSLLVHMSESLHNISTNIPQYAYPYQKVSNSFRPLTVSPSHSTRSRPQRRPRVFTINCLRQTLESNCLPKPRPSESAAGWHPSTEKSLNQRVQTTRPRLKHVHRNRVSIWHAQVIQDVDTYRIHWRVCALYMSILWSGYGMLIRRFPD